MRIELIGGPLHGQYREVPDDLGRLNAYQQPPFKLTPWRSPHPPPRREYVIHTYVRINERQFRYQEGHA